MKHGNDESKFHIAFIGKRADVQLSPAFLITDFDSKWTARMFTGLVNFYKIQEASVVHFVLIIMLSKVICFSGKEKVIIKLLHVTQVLMSYIL